MRHGPSTSQPSSADTPAAGRRFRRLSRSSRRHYVPGGRRIVFTCVTDNRRPILTSNLGRQCRRAAIAEVGSSVSSLAVVWAGNSRCWWRARHTLREKVGSGVSSLAVEWVGNSRCWWRARHTLREKDTDLLEGIATVYNDELGGSWIRTERYQRESAVGIVRVSTSNNLRRGICRAASCSWLIGICRSP